MRRASVIKGKTGMPNGAARPLDTRSPQLCQRPQNLTTTEITITISKTVGTSFINR